VTNEFGALDSTEELSNLDFVEDVIVAPSDPTPPDNEPQAPSRITFEIDPDDIYGSIRRLTESDPKVANVINSMVGMKARTQYEPKIRETQIQLERLQRERETNLVNSVPEKDRDARAGSDPAFAAMRDRVRQPDTTSAKEAALSVQRIVNQTLEAAINQGLSPDKAEEFLNKLTSGGYDNDAKGNPIGVESSLAMLNADIMTTVRSVAPATRAAVPAEGGSQAVVLPTATPPSPPRDSATPDMSSSSSGATGPRFTVAEIRVMTPDVFERHFPTEDDYERAIKERRISGISEDVINSL